MIPAHHELEGVGRGVRRSPRRDDLARVPDPLGDVEVHTLMSTASSALTAGPSDRQSSIASAVMR